MSSHILKDRDKNSRWDLLVVGLAAGSVLAIGLIWLIHDGTNYQEKYNLSISLMPHLTLFHAGSNDDPMALYFLLLHIFNSWISPAKALLFDRVLSLAAYVLLVFVAYLIGRLAGGRSRIGLVSALVVAASPFLIWYSSRATVYSLLALAVALNQLCFIGLMKGRRWALMTYLPSCLLGLGLHFFSWRSWYPNWVI